MLQKQVDSIEKQRNYLMKKLQDTKNNMETKKFIILKDFEVEKLDLLKKIEELLMLNDILAGQKMIYDMKGKKIDTQEILGMLNPFQLIKNIHGQKGKNNKEALSIEQQANYNGNLTIKDIMNNLSQKYIDSKGVGLMTPEALRNPLTRKMLCTPMKEGIN